ncbi:MAG: glycine cleavage system protein GcvH [Oscillatoriales cyanobacterium SM2_2_1]|nr:glycine cleavage system protein GcvH [Oscillatoriales cyanobacterium SM2_2_1]
MNFPDDLEYTASHEYLRWEDDVATVGITAFAVDQLGDIVFLSLPAVGATVSQGEAFGTVESVKAVEDIYAPVSGEVVAANTPLTDEPESLGSDPYAAWLLKIKVTGGDRTPVMTAAQYRAKVEGHA